MAQTVKKSACYAGDVGLIPRSGKYPEGGHGNHVQYSCLESSKNRGTWKATVHGFAKSQDD